MFAETVSLGILSLPSVVANLGMVPGVILIVGLGLIGLWPIFDIANSYANIGVATYTGYAMFQFKMRHPHVNFPVLRSRVPLFLTNPRLLIWRMLERSCLDPLAGKY